MPNKLEKLKAIIELMQNDTITPKQVKEFLDYVLKSIVTARKDIEELSDEHLKLIKDAVYYIESKKKETISDIESSKKSIKEDFESKLRNANDFLEEVKRIKVTKGDNGKPGKDGAKGKDGKNGKNGKDGSPDTAKQVRDKLETLEGEDRLDATAIKNLPEFIKDDKRIGFGSMIREAPKDGTIYGRQNRQWVEVTSGGGGGHTIQDEGTPLTQRTNLNFVGANVEVTDDAGNNATIVTISGAGGGGTWGSITGTLSDQTDLQGELDAKQDALGFTAENVSNKSTSVVTDQASNTKYPSVKAVYDWAIGAFTTTSAVASQITTALSGYATETFVTTQGYITNVVTALGFTPENVSNKSTTLNTDQASDTKYPSVKSVYDWATGLFQTLSNLSTDLTASATKYPSVNAVNTGLSAKQDALGFTAENVANKSTTTTLGTSDTLYPTQNAVKTYVDNAWIVQPINAQTGTTYTFVLSDAGKLVTGSNASAITFTVPPNSSVAFAVGTHIDITQTGAGVLSIAPGSGVTINSQDSNRKIFAQYVSATLIKTATDTWLLVGNLKT